MKSLEASRQKTNQGEAINSLALLVCVRIWIPATRRILHLRLAVRHCQKSFFFFFPKTILNSILVLKVTLIGGRLYLSHNVVEKYEPEGKRKFNKLLTIPSSDSEAELVLTAIKPGRLFQIFSAQMCEVLSESLHQSVHFILR